MVADHIELVVPSGIAMANPFGITGADPFGIEGHYRKLVAAGSSGITDFDSEITYSEGIGTLDSDKFGCSINLPFSM